RLLREIIAAKKEYDDKKLGKADIQKAKASFSEFIKYMIEYMQRRHMQEIEKAKIKVKCGNSYGEVIFLEKQAFIIQNSGEDSKKVSKAQVSEDGEIGELSPSSFEEMDTALASQHSAPRILIKEKSFESLKRIFGKDVEVIINI
ncbi:MAG: hypothetical protein NTZ02_02380, partial [Candidatus Woesearchaeota archaeon]|nr:hypothetical protein [Candidatus Woesearchaeota archaeon]